MSLSSLRRWTMVLAGAGLLGLGGITRGDDESQKISPPPLARTSAEPAPAPSIADPLAGQVDEAIRVTSRRFLDADVHTPWQIMHGMLAYRRDYLLRLKGQKVNALEWIANGATYQGQPWFEKTSFGGHAHPYNGTPYAFQGHPCQFMACLTMCDLPLDFKFKAGAGETVTVSDLIRGAQAEVNDREEVTWVLWFLTHYLEPDAQWTNKDGEPWSIERLVQVETGKTVTAGACGGAHGLFALAYARNSYLTTGRPLYGAWLEADQKVRRYVEEARTLQNPDGTFSSNFFRGPGQSQEFEKRLGSTGHILEFLCVALPQSRLNEEWLRRAVGAIANDLNQNRLAPCECGAMYHSVDGLSLYRTRVWPELDPARRTVTTAKPVMTSVPSGSGSVTKTSANGTPAAEAPTDKPSQDQAVNGAAR
jgi:hypothetical protein